MAKFRIDPEKLPEFLWENHHATGGIGAPRQMRVSGVLLHPGSSREVQYVAGTWVETKQKCKVAVGRLFASEVDAKKNLELGMARAKQIREMSLTDRQRQLKKSRKNATPVPGQTER
jgi:hypothetical protein